MSENTKQEIDALLEFIQRKRFELLEDYCIHWKRCVKGVLDRNEAQPRNKEEEQLRHIPAPDPDLIFKYSSAIDYNDIDFGKTYLDVSEYWEKFYQEFSTVEYYIRNVMEIHWFLLYYTHRFRLTNWKRTTPSVIWIENSNSASVKEIDGYLMYILDYYGPTFGREMIQDIMTFAAKAIQAIAPVSIIDIYEDVNLDRPARINALESRLNSLPFTQGMAFTEVLDSLLFTLSHGKYTEILAFHRLYCHSIPSYKYLYINDESLQVSFNNIRKSFPRILPPFFEDTEVFLNAIKDEYAANRDLVDDDACKIIDGWLVSSRNAEDKVKTNNQVSKGSSKAGAPIKTWLKVQLDDETIKDKMEKVVWAGIREDIENLTYPEQKGERKNKTQKAFAAAIIFFSAQKLGLTIEKKYNLPAERTFSFLPAPRTSVNSYLDKLKRWYNLAIGAQRKSDFNRQTLERWKKEDSIRANFFINNILAMQDIINNAMYLLGNAFGVKTELEFKSASIPSDGTTSFDENKAINNNGHHSKTGHPLSYSSD